MLSFDEVEIVQKEFDRIILHAVYYIVSKQKYFILCVVKHLFLILSSYPNLLRLMKVNIDQEAAHHK